MQLQPYPPLPPLSSSADFRTSFSLHLPSYPLAWYDVMTLNRQGTNRDASWWLPILLLVTRGKIQVSLSSPFAPENLVLVRQVWPFRSASQSARLFFTPKLNIVGRQVIRWRIRWWWCWWFPWPRIIIIYFPIGFQSTAGQKKRARCLLALLQPETRTVLQPTFFLGTVCSRAVIYYAWCVNELALLQLQ